MDKKRWTLFLAACTMLASTILATGKPATAQSSRTFPQTGKTVSGKFLQYWNTHGGLAQQGYPISEEMQEVDKDGVTRTTQYFERAVFELHPEHAGTPNEVLLSLLGVFYYDEKYQGSAPGQQTSTDNPRLFDATGYSIGGAFRRYWETHGGLAQQGYPISEEFQEIDKDGVQRTVQYFERAVFEYHEEYAGTSSEVLLSLLGVFYYERKHGGSGGPNPPTPTHTPPDPGSPSVTPVPPAPLDNTGQVIFYNSDGGNAIIGYVDPFGAYRDLKTAFAGSMGWTHIVPVGDGRLLFYKKNNGDCVVGQVATDGTYTDLKACKGNIPKGLTHLAVTGHGLILAYTQGTFTARSMRVEADGSLTTLYTFRPEVAGWLPSSSNWTHLVGLENGVFVFYERGTPKAETVRLNTDGNVTKLKSFNNWTTVWTHLVPGAGGLLLQYYMTDGRGVVSRFDANGNEVAVVKHPDPGKNLDPLPRAMPIVAGFSSGPLSFYNDSDGTMITGRMTAEGVIIYQQECCALKWTHVVAIR